MKCPKNLVVASETKPKAAIGLPIHIKKCCGPKNTSVESVAKLAIATHVVWNTSIAVNQMREQKNWRDFHFYFEPQYQYQYQP